MPEIITRNERGSELTFLLGDEQIAEAQLAVTGNLSLDQQHNREHLVITSGANTLSLDTASDLNTALNSTASEKVGWRVAISNNSGSTNTIDLTTAADTLNGVANGTFSLLDNESVIIHFDNVSGTKGYNITGLYSARSRAFGLQTIWVPAGAMTPTFSNGCSALTTVETTSGRPDINVLDFATGSDEHAQFSVAFPNSWDLGTVTAQFFWTHAGSQGAGLDGVAFGIQGVAVSSDDTIDVAYGTGVVMTAVDGATAEDLYVSASTTAITIAGTPADADLCYFRVYRDVSDAGDDLDIDARLIGVKLFYTTDTGNDA